MSKFIRLAKKAEKMGFTLSMDQFGYWLEYHDEHDSSRNFKSLREVEEELMR